MGRIINITSKKVYIKEKDSCLVISKDLFLFNPQVGNIVKVIKNINGDVIKIDLIQRHVLPLSRRKSTIFQKIVAFYTIVLLALFFLIIIDDNSLDEIFSAVAFITLSIMLIVVILSLATTNEKKLYLYSVILMMFYSLMFLLGFPILFIKEGNAGWLLILFNAIPIILLSIYFYYNKKELEAIDMLFPAHLYKKILK